jgi:hypothetical protein
VSDAEGGAERRAPKRRARRGERAESPPEASPPPSTADDAPPNDAGPPFAARYPRAPELDPLLASFDMGDYATVRRDAARLARDTDDEAVRAAARDLAARLDPDPLAKVLVGAAAALLVALAAHYFAHAHAP